MRVNADGAFSDRRANNTGSIISPPDVNFVDTPSDGDEITPEESELLRSIQADLLSGPGKMKASMLEAILFNTMVDIARPEFPGEWLKLSQQAGYTTLLVRMGLIRQAGSRWAITSIGSDVCDCLLAAGAGER